jgi:hypothetical protein
MGKSVRTSAAETTRNGVAACIEGFINPSQLESLEIFRNPIAILDVAAPEM